MVQQNGVKVYHSVDDIGDLIDQLSNDSFFTYGWFKTLESFGRLPEPLYVTLSHDGDTIGIAPCFKDKVNDFFEWGPNIMPFLNWGLNVSQKLGFNKDFLLCYSPACCRTKILLAKQYNNRAILSLFSKKIDDICKEQKILFSSFLFVSEFDGLLMKNLESLNYTKFSNIVTFYLDVSWSNFEDYVKSLKLGRRRTVRHEIKKCSENGVTLKEESISEDIAEKLSELGANVSSKYSPKEQTRLDPSFFKILQKYAKDKARLFVARKNDKVVGFSLGLQHKDVLDMYMYGCDYASQTNTSFIYFNLGYYEPIKLAINENIKKIYFRYLNEKAKVARGCRPEQTYSFIKCHSTIFAPVMNNVFKSIFYSTVKSRVLPDYFRHL
jgi:predicted N-acyltransferase